MTTNTTPAVPAWRQKIAGIRQRVDEADAKKKRAELNKANDILWKHRRDLTWVLSHFDMFPSFGEGSAVGEVDGFSFTLTYIEINDEFGAGYNVGLFITHALHSRTVWLSAQQESNWVLERANLRPIDAIAYDLDVALEALESEAVR